VPVAAEEISAATSPGWSWDPTLYAGSARFYPVGRVAYPAELVDVLVDALALDGSGRLLDVGCGPGSLTLLLASRFGEAIGVDADADMLVEAARLAEQENVRNVSWCHRRAEELPAGLLAMRVATFAQSLHWMDRPRVVAAVRAMLEPGGAVVHVHATTHQGLDSDSRLAHPRPPREQIERLVRGYLGPQPRAGQGVLTAGASEPEEVIYRAAGFTGPERFEVPGRVLERNIEEITASVYSLSSAAPHLFGDRLEQFDAELRQLLDEAADDGRFSEQMRSIAVDIWR
jgi:ubiquinone/menaquinone biosynthesis C-methylase UbiE